MLFTTNVYFLFTNTYAGQRLNNVTDTSDKLILKQIIFVNSQSKFHNEFTLGIHLYIIFLKKNSKYLLTTSLPYDIIRCKVIYFTGKAVVQVSQTFEKNLLIPCLLDIYGELLTDRKRELLDYYYEEDYSLSEISELTGISRQGVRDSIKKSSAELLGLEDKLRLYEKKSSISKLIEESRDSLDSISVSANDKTVLVSLKMRLSAIEELL